MACKDKISNIIEEKREVFIEASDKIWGFSETRFQEYKAVELLSSILEKEEFRITKGVGGIDTAFVATYGSGKPEIGILGEYDALYDLSQKAGVSVKQAVEEGESGHGCGHNALGVGSLAAAVAVKEYITENNISGTIHYFGCPGEEGGWGKTFMAKEKIFDGLDAAFSWHPGDTNGLFTTSSLAVIQGYFKFYGVSTHASAAPHFGRSALDAVELMNVGVNYLREHVIPEARIHYAITNTGGNSPNVVQSNAEALYFVRAPKIEQAKEIYERVINVAKGAELMTGTTSEVVFDSATSELIINDTLNQVLQDKFIELGLVEIDDNDIKYAQEIRSTLTEAEIKSTLKRFDKETQKELEGKAIADIINPYKISDKVMSGSTDVGDVSWIVPTAQCTTACYALGTPGHSWQNVAQGKSELIHKGLLLAGKIIALSALELFENPEIIKKAKKELKEKLDGKEYVCPIPYDVKPAVIR